MAETGSEDGSATTRPPEPRSRLMKYEEALQILLNGPPDLSQDEILGDSDNEEEESHYTPQIVKLVAGSAFKEAMDHLDENSDGTIGEEEFVNWFVNR